LKLVQNDTAKSISISELHAALTTDANIKHLENTLWDQVSAKADKNS